MQICQLIFEKQINEFIGGIEPFQQKMIQQVVMHRQNRQTNAQKARLIKGNTDK